MKTILLWTTPYFGVLLLPKSAWSYGLEMGDWHGQMWGSAMLFGPLMMIVFFVIIIVLIVLVLRWLSGIGHRSPTQTGKTAFDILDERFARGEIEKVEYEERKRTLSA